MWIIIWSQQQTTGKTCFASLSLPCADCMYASKKCNSDSSLSLRTFQASSGSWLRRALCGFTHQGNADWLLSVPAANVACEAGELQDIRRETSQKIPKRFTRVWCLCRSAGIRRKIERHSSSEMFWRRATYRCCLEKTWETSCLIIPTEPACWSWAQKYTSDLQTTQTNADAPGLNSLHILPSHYLPYHTGYSGYLDEAASVVKVAKWSYQVDFKQKMPAFSLFLRSPSFLLSSGKEQLVANLAEHNACNCMANILVLFILLCNTTVRPFGSHL